jgi:hypothetical protein
MKKKKRNNENGKNIKIRKVMKNIMNILIDTNYSCLIATSESQGHGKAFEVDIQKRCFVMTDEEIRTYPSNAIYDIRKEHNRINKRNISIKVSGGMNIDCGDIKRFLTSEDMDIICVIYKQEGSIKISVKTIVFKFEDFIKILKTDVVKFCGISYDEWLQKVIEYDTYVKVLPKEYYPSSKLIPQKDREHLNKKAPLCSKIRYFNIAPKIDNDQQRVQCTINLNQIKELTMNIYEGGVLYDKEYTKTINSGTRTRHAKSN